MKVERYVCLMLSTVVVIFSSCSDKWLEAKPDDALTVPATLKDFRHLLDNTAFPYGNTQSSALSEISSGDFYITYASWLSVYTVQEKMAYIWGDSKNFYGLDASADWESGYRRVLNANIILDRIDKVSPGPSTQKEWDNVKGSALFLRAFDYFHLSQGFCKVYDPTTVKTDLGLPLRISPDVNIVLKRATLEETYNLVLSDLKSAASLLDKTPLFKTRPSKQAAFALLARAYLSMERYDEAELYADSALQIQSDLLDYSTLNNKLSYPIGRYNTEVIYHSTFSFGIFSSTRLIVEPDIYNSYSADDYRRTVLFKAVGGGAFTFRGSYGGDKNLFGGLATDELYLIRAESKARKGDLSGALADLNLLLGKRYTTGFTPLACNDAEEVLRIVLHERRKELLFRGIRWSDLRRLNRDKRFAVTLTRTLNGQIYQLLPGDKRYVLPIDEQEIKLGGIEQNDR